MSTLLIGDIHGCFQELQSLLAQAKFDPQKDTLWLTGDLVARGPESLYVLRYVYSLGDAVRIVLGNHDLHLLAIYAGITRKKNKDNLDQLLAAPDCDQLLNWLRKQPLLQVDDDLGIVMAHAGITPQWDLPTAQKCAKEVELVLASDCYPLFLDAMYGDLPNNWNDKLSGLSRLRYITNALTRMRYCYPNRYLDMYCKNSPKDVNPPLKPWFELTSQITDHAIVFGHWAALEGKGAPAGYYPLDTGCCWGGELTMLRWEDKTYFRQPSRNASIIS